MIGGYNSREAAQFKYILRLMLKGFLYGDYMPRLGEFYAEMGPWVASGKVKAHETVADGLEAMPQAFLGLFSGANTGKMLVRV